MQPLLGNVRLDPLTSLVNMSVALRLPRDLHLCRSSDCPTPPSGFWTCYKTTARQPHLARCIIPCTRHAEAHPNFKKCSENETLISKRASRHNEVHFLNISDYKNAPSLLHVCCISYMLALIRAAHCNTKHFSNSSTSNSGLRPAVFDTFDFDT